MAGGVGCFKYNKKKHLRLLPLSFVEESLYMFLSSSPKQLQSGSEQLPVHVRGPLRFSAASNLPFMLKTAF